MYHYLGQYRNAILILGYIFTWVSIFLRGIYTQVYNFFFLTQTFSCHHRISCPQEQMIHIELSFSWNVTTVNIGLP